MNMDKERVAALGWQFDVPLATMGLPHHGPARMLGEILGDRIALSPQRVREILDHAEARGTRFGDAAVALGYASAEEVLLALSAQFEYPCSAPVARLDSSELVMLARPHSAQAEAIRALRSQITRRVSRIGGGRHALAIVSPQAGDGKTFLVANLAVALAQTGARTLVVDADMRGPRLHEIFRLQGRHGLSSALVGRGDAEIIQSVPGVQGLYALPCGITPPNPLELIERSAFASLMDKLPHHFDHVLVDTPAIAYGADALAIADRCRASLLLARRNESDLKALRRAVDDLNECRGELLGTIINDF
jgi:chain length determinant protein tyrosine kinase EpsG